MKITISKKPDNLNVPFNNIPLQMVYKVAGDVVLWKINSTNAVVLCGYDNSNYVAMAAGFKEKPAIEFLGHVSEIIIKPLE